MMTIRIIMMKMMKKIMIGRHRVTENKDSKLCWGLGGHWEMEIARRHPLICF